MAIAFDQAGSGSGSGTSLTYSATVGTLVDGILFVGTTIANAGDTVTGVTFNGSAMTKISSQQMGSGNVYLTLWYLASPASGTHNVVVSASASSTSLQAANVSYSGAKGTGIPDASGTFTSTSATTATKAVTSIADNCWAVFFAANFSTALGAGTDSTLRVDIGGGAGAIVDTNGSITPAGSRTLIITGDGANHAWGGVMATFAPDISDRYWVGGTGDWDASTTTHWSKTSGGSGGASVPVALTPAVHFDANSGSGTVTVTAQAYCTDLDFTGYTGTFAGSSALAISGSLILGSGMTNSYTGTITFNSTSSGKTITSATKSLSSPVVFNGSGGVWTLQDAFTASTVTITAGTLVLGSFTTSLTGTGTVWSCAGSVTANTSTIKITNASSSTKTFAGNGKTYYNLWITGAGTGAYTISGSNTFTDFKVDTPPHTVNFTAGTTQTLTTFTVNGTAGNLMTLQSTSAGSAWYLVKATSGTVTCNYLSLQDSHVS